MELTERFLRYVRIDTTSDDESTTFPSTPVQKDLAVFLEEELRQMGADTVLTEYGYVYAGIPATPGYENTQKLGFMAHMDTSSSASGKNVNPRIHENYDGKDIALGNGRTLSSSEFQHLGDLAGRTLITSDGSTLLGADDKAGIAELMDISERLLKGDIPHGPIRICFTPDEETGRGTEHFSKELFDSEIAYTLDGGAENCLEYECFNACSAEVFLTGKSVHPGAAKDTMINACMLAVEFQNMLPGAEVPEHTSGYEGFYHLTGIACSVEKGKLTYILRDHNISILEQRKAVLKKIEMIMNEKYGTGTVEILLKDSYRNMAEYIRPHMYMIDKACEAIRKCGMEPYISPVRGGTDGAELSRMGIPCPNLGTGGHAYHGPYEHITVEGMQKARDVVLELIRLYSIGEKIPSSIPEGA